ncbi:lysylphosphatidylglycerol synthase transmembrane domain-containing protein [Patiriisocius marinus]|uniref:Membrane protein n=1 Tax=Patiriisocius marinus TaxID=1397112 RepID=A0A5J4J350_9FLAO|nr:lysylphosphatidylglycerol synthase transmembrane domain-containing protein [Patiriisocius marinus]GER60300.1 membrane protein [Patiriisocius marinus]
MNKIISKFLQIGIPLGFGIFLIWFTYNKFTPEQFVELKAYFSNANYGIVVLSVLLSVLSHFLRAYRWNFMLQPLGYKPKLANNFMAISIAYLMNIFIPKSGEVSRGLIMDKYEKIPFEKGFGSIISERIVDLIFLMIFTFTALFLKFDVLYEYIASSIPKKLMYAAGIGFIVFSIALIFLLKFKTFTIPAKIKNFIDGLKDGVLSIVKMKKKKAFILHSLFIWGLYVASFYTATHALIETSSIPLSTIIIAFVVGSFTFAFTNSGFGTYPAAIAGILVLFAVPFTVGTAFGWIVWISNITSIVVIGVISLITLPLYNKNKLA